MPEEKPEKEMEELSRAIVAAITGSKEVRLAMEKICEQEKVGARSYMMMMLELNNLANYLGLSADAPPSDEDIADDEERAALLGDADADDEREESVAESETFSKNELAFREFLAERFDETEWLSKNKISFGR